MLSFSRPRQACATSGWIWQGEWKRISATPFRTFGPIFFAASSSALTSSRAARSAAVSGCWPEVISFGPSAFSSSASAGPASPEAERRGAFSSVTASRSAVTP
jgi:hypothetical protein